MGCGKGDYKLWTDVGREFTPDWKALVQKLEDSDLALFDLGKDPSESKDLRKELPKVYQSLKQELIAHFDNINAEYPTRETHPDLFTSVKNRSEASSHKALESPKSLVASQAVSLRGARNNAFVTMDQNKDGKVTEGELDIWFKIRRKKLLVNSPTSQTRVREPLRNVTKIKMGAYELGRVD